jgi:hypothetical protein
MTDSSDQMKSDDHVERQLQALLGRSGLEVYPDEVQTAVEASLAAGQSLEPSTRLMFVDAARRGASYVAELQSPLEVMLFKRRRDLGKKAIDVGSEMEVNDILSIERGDRSIDSESPRRIASWSLNLQLSRSDVETGLRWSLAPPSPAGVYAGSAPVDLSVEHEEFVAAVVEAFDELIESKHQ